MDAPQQTVEQFLSGECSVGLLHELAVVSLYWKGALDFYEKNEKKEYKSLTFKERNWLIKIKNDLIEEGSNAR